MVHFDDAHRRVHLPDDRRMVIILRRRYIICLIVVVAIPIGLAWMQVLAFGIHSPVTGIAPNGVPRGFPVWIRWTHFANLLFLFLLSAAASRSSWTVRGSTETTTARRARNGCASRR
jgi:hypothetical protein